MPKFAYALALSLVMSAVYVGTRPASAAESCCRETGEVTAATCNPNGICRACKNCRYCGYCKAGGKCSVCAPPVPTKTLAPDKASPEKPAAR